MTIARFEKVSPEQYRKDMHAAFDDSVGPTDEQIDALYEAIELPRRATEGSAGYDFFLPFPWIMEAKHEQVFPTGIRCRMDPGWVLLIFPRSGYGFKTGLKLMNTVGVIDSDYFGADNEGHILVKLDLPDEYFSSLKLERGKGFVQGIFLPYGLAAEGGRFEARRGGFGSTDAR